MYEHAVRRKRTLLIILSLLLAVGFLGTSLVSYYVARASLRRQIDSTALPLTSDTIYSEIQRDLLKPIFISSLMAHDTFLRDWMLNGEQDPQQVTRYLHEIMVKYQTFTSFLVSEQTRTYYHASGILKQIRDDEPRDRWYFRVRSMPQAYETNVDPDLANQDAMTIFINHRVLDYHGRFIGAVGVGLTTAAVRNLITDYRVRYGHHISFADPTGRIILHSAPDAAYGATIHDVDGLAAVAHTVLSSDRSILTYPRQGTRVHLHSRFIPELNWYLLVEQPEAQAIGRINRALVVNLLLCTLFTALAVVATTVTINAYQRINLAQQQQITDQHRSLTTKNQELESALTEVRTLSGLLPICSACKKIRDDRGYWQQIESYIRIHSNAEFSHGICPECMEKLYPELKR